MTFKGMLKIMMNDFKKQHEEKMYSVVDELMRTRRELREVKEQLRCLQLTSNPPPSATSTISKHIKILFVRYNGLSNELSDIRKTMTIKELLIELRQLTRISTKQPIRIRVLSSDGLTTLFFLDKELNRTLESYGEELKSGMILSIEDDQKDIFDEKTHLSPRSQSITSSERTHSYESDV